eukprot:scaffold26936_cov32-Attheya_sp.AAC.2
MMTTNKAKALQVMVSHVLDGGSFWGGDPRDEMSIATSALESFMLDWVTLDGCRFEILHWLRFSFNLYTFMRSFVSSLEEGIIFVHVCAIKAQHQNGAWFVTTCFVRWMRMIRVIGVVVVINNKVDDKGVFLKDAEGVGASGETENGVHGCTLLVGRRITLTSSKKGYVGCHSNMLKRYHPIGMTNGKLVVWDVDKDLQGWAKRCRAGCYDELPDVEMYTHDGYDRDGLDLWLRNRGSKAENFHQKMKVGAGPHDMGVETAHYYQVLLTYLYLVNAGVRRCGWPDFAHTMIPLED